MNTTELIDLFQTHHNEYLNNDTPSSDLDALNFLNTLVPVKHDMISMCRYESFILETDIDKLAERATEADIITLLRLGILYDEDLDSLYMFV